MDDVHPFKESYRLFNLDPDGNFVFEREITKTHELLNNTYEMLNNHLFEYMTCIKKNEITLIVYN